MDPESLPASTTREPGPNRHSKLQIRLLGRFELEFAHWVIDESAWRLRKASQIVKLLALAPNRTRHRDELIELLWPDQDTETGNRNLRYATHMARRVIRQLPLPSKPTDALQLQQEQLTLFPDDSPWIDVTAFEQAAGAARHNPELALIEAAVALYAGDLLPADRYEDWAIGHRERLRETYLELLLELSRCHEASGALSNAIEALQHIVAHEPAHEAAHTGLMRAYARSGLRHQALRQYEQLHSALQFELEIEPQPASSKLHEDIQAGRIPDPVLSQARHPQVLEPPWPTNLPTPLTSFVGRRHELARIQELMRFSRLVTLAGPGGSGKTRLATEFGRALGECSPDGVWLIDLSPLSDADLVARTVASTLGVPEEAGVPISASVARWLFSRDLILILDNCEHLAAESARLASHLLGACPKLRILATSRERLHIAGETVWRITPLELPGADQQQSLERLVRHEAVQLFVERARLVHPTFTVTIHEARIIAEICRRLEGLPLAIELAAARLTSLSLEQLLERIDDAMRLLASPGPTLAHRQRTMQATLDWSYGLLTEGDRAFWRHMAVFAGSWSIEAAEAVAQSAGIETSRVLDMVARLVDKSMISVDLSSEAARYRLLELLRQYALQRLEEHHEVESARRRHAAYYLTLAETAELELRGSDQARWLAQLESKHDNLRAALRWSVAQSNDETHTGLRLAGALAQFWWVRGHYQEGRDWLSTALNGTNPEDAFAATEKALTGLFMIAFRQGDLTTARATAEQRLKLGRKLGNEQSIAWSLTYLSWVVGDLGERTKEAELLGEALELFRQSNDTEGIAAALNALGESARVVGDDLNAVPLYEESLAHYRELDDRLYIVTVSLNLAWSLARLGEFARAAALFRECLQQSVELDSKVGISIALTGLADMAVRAGQVKRAALLLSSAESLRLRIGAVPDETDLAQFRSSVVTVQRHLSDQAFSDAWRSGAEMLLDDAIEVALGLSVPPSLARSDSMPVTNLSPRELEVTKLIVDGSTNVHIAERLGISTRTVDKHVSNILRKLGLASRHQISEWLAGQ